MSKMSQRKKPQLVQVSWVDAGHAAGWVNDQQVDDEELAGYLSHPHRPSLPAWRGEFGSSRPTPRQRGCERPAPNEGRLGVLRGLLERVQRRDTAWCDVAHVARDKDEVMLLCGRGE